MQNAGRTLKHIYATTLLATTLLAVRNWPDQHFRFYFLETMTDVSASIQTLSSYPLPIQQQTRPTTQKFKGQINSYHQSYHSLLKIHVC